jgi:DNA-binding NarL/FixJ family response regulator
VSSVDQERVLEIERQLETFRIGAPSTIRPMMSEMRRLLDAETLILHCPVERATGWELEQSEFETPPEIMRRARRFFESSAPRSYGAGYDATHPEPAQRDRVIDAIDVLSPEAFERSAIYTQVIYPSNLHRHRQPRVLICEGPSLLAWFGSFHPSRFDRRQRRLLKALVPALKRRLRLERQLRTAPTAAAALPVVLEQLGAPAFVLSRQSGCVEMNSAARALLELRRAEVLPALFDAVAGRPTHLQIELVPVVEAGTSACWLAIIRAGGTDVRTMSALVSASKRWRLTPRQREVLTHVLDGDATTTIAAQLDISERAVELHLTKLFERAEVGNRAALVAKVLLNR